MAASDRGIPCPTPSAVAGWHSSPWSTESPWELVDDADSEATLPSASSRQLGCGPGSLIFIGSSEFWTRCSVIHSWRNDTEELLLSPPCTSYNPRPPSPHPLPQGKPHRSSCFFISSSPQPKGCLAKGALDSWSEPMFPSGPFHVLRHRGVQRLGQDPCTLQTFLH